MSSISHTHETSAILKNILAKLDPYLRLEANELCFNRPQEIMVDRGDYWEKIIDDSLTYELLVSFLKELATRRNQRFNERYCHLACELPPPYLRYRVQAQHQTSLFNSQIGICIRIPSTTRFNLENFIFSQKLLDEGWTYQKIKDLVKGHYSILISGGTGSGKTSFLNSLMGELEPSERIITIEDSQELFVPNENLLQLAVPKEETEIYSYTSAINNALRLRPDRLFLGEIDIRNTFAFLRASNTGHAGNFSTLHANNPQDAIKAIIQNIILSGGLQNPDKTLLLELIITAVDYIIQIKREKGSRVITDILKLKEDYKNII